MAKEHQTKPKLIEGQKMTPKVMKPKQTTTKVIRQVKNTDIIPTGPKRNFNNVPTMGLKAPEVVE